MNILLTCATSGEADLIRERWNIDLVPTGEAMSWMHGPHRISLLVTGIGMVNTSMVLTPYIQYRNLDLAIQFGIAGAMPDSHAVGAVVEVVEDCYGDLGAESPEGFLDLAAMGFANFTDANGRVYHNSIPNPGAGRSGLPPARAITVNRVHGTAGSIAASRAQWNHEVESMEGAAFFQLCLQTRTPCMQIRGISNLIEPRDRSSWRIPEAIAASQQAVISFLESLPN